MRTPTVTPKLQRLAAPATRDPARVFTPRAPRIDGALRPAAYRHPRKSSAAGRDGGTAKP